VHTDLSIPSSGVPLSFTRGYSAQAPFDDDSTSILGTKWSFNWQARLVVINSDAVVLDLPAGSGQVWRKTSSVWVPPPGIEGNLVQNGDGSWTLTTGSQLVYSFDSSGVWTSVADRN